MDRDWIDTLRIEHRGENGGMNITVFLSRPPRIRHELPTHCDLVTLVANMFRDAIDPDAKRFKATNAEVMTWSDEEHRGLTSPHRYRVTVDFELLTPEPGAGRFD